MGHVAKGVEMRVRNVKFNGKNVPDVTGFLAEASREANSETGLPCDFTRPMKFILDEQGPDGLVQGIDR
jgi:hypothetical protein